MGLGEEERLWVPSFQTGPGEISFPNKLIHLFQLELEAALAHCFHVSVAQVCLVSKECLCFVFPQGGLAEQGSRLAKAVWGRTAQSLEAGVSGAGRAWWLCVQHRSSSSSVRGEGGLWPFVICCKWCQRLWLKISGWLVGQLAD